MNSSPQPRLHVPAAASGSRALPAALRPLLTRRQRCSSPFPAGKLRQGAQFVLVLREQAESGAAAAGPPSSAAAPGASSPPPARPAGLAGAAVGDREPGALRRSPHLSCLSFPAAPDRGGPSRSPPRPRPGAGPRPAAEQRPRPPGHGAHRAAGAAAGAAAGPGPPGTSQRAAHQPGPPARPRGASRPAADGGTGRRAPLRAAAPRAAHLVRSLRGLRLGRRQEEPPVPP